MQLLGADEVADRLGVKVETVYAYVSRGVLTSHRPDQGRRSGFDPEEVESLARRGRPRRTTRPPVLDFTIATSLTHIEDHRITHRGHDQRELAATCSFEQVAELLWSGVLPPSPPSWGQVAPPGAANGSGTPAPWPAELQGDLMDRIRSAVVLAAAADPARADLRPAAVAAAARTLLTSAVMALPTVGSGRVPRLSLPGHSPVRHSVAGLLWARLSPRRPTAAAVRVLNTALVLLADHELASSTLAARVAASTRADPYSVVLAGLGVLAGPLHGGASRTARRMLSVACAEGPGAAMADALAVHGALPGFGHPLYPAGDPRARQLLDAVHEAFADRPDTRAVMDLVELARRREGPEPNVDFALAALGHLGAMPEPAGEVIFTVSRTAGWVAHALEEYGDTPLRFRARAVRAK